MNNEIIEFKKGNLVLNVPISWKEETVWLNRNQMAELFGRDIKTIGKHIVNALNEELSVVADFAPTQNIEGTKATLPNSVVAKIATTTKHGAIEDKTQTHMVEHYNLDVIISVGYTMTVCNAVSHACYSDGFLLT